MLLASFPQVLMLLGFQPFGGSVINKVGSWLSLQLAYGCYIICCSIGFPTSQVLSLLSFLLFSHPWWSTTLKTSLSVILLGLWKGLTVDTSDPLSLLRSCLVISVRSKMIFPSLASAYHLPFYKEPILPFQVQATCEWHYKFLFTFRSSNMS